MNEGRKQSSIAFGALLVIFALGWIFTEVLYKDDHHHWMALVGYVEILLVIALAVGFARVTGGVPRDVAVAAVVFAAVTTLGRLVAWVPTHERAPGFLYHHNLGITTVTAFVALGLLAVVVAVAAYRWIVRLPMVQAGPHLVVAIALGALIASFTGPAASRAYPFEDGPGTFFLRIWLFLGCAVIGIVFGYMVAVAMGRDYRTRGLEALAAKSRTAARAAGRPAAKQTAAKQTAAKPRTAVKPAADRPTKAARR